MTNIKELQEMFSKIVEEEGDPEHLFARALADVAPSELTVIKENLKDSMPKETFNVTLTFDITVPSGEDSSARFGQEIAEMFNNSPLSTEEWFIDNICDWDIWYSR